MPWCPACRNEYEVRATRCGDCGVDLVAERPAASEGEAEGPAFVPLVPSDGEVAARVKSALDSLRVPAGEATGPDGRDALVVPTAFFSVAADRLHEILPDLVFSPAEGFVEVRRHDPARDREIRDHPVLREPFSDLKARGPAARADLRACLVHGSRSVRQRALALLFRFGAERFEDLGFALGEAVEGKDDVVAAEILHELGAEAERGRTEWPESVARLAALPASGERALRDWGIRIAGRLRLRSAGTTLVGLLRHADFEVAVSADEALCEITGEEPALEEGMSPQEIARIAEARSRRLA